MLGLLTLTLDRIYRQTSLGGLLVFLLHVETCVAHGFYDFIKRNKMFSRPSQSHQGGIDRLYCGEGIALNTGHLNQTSHRVTGKPKIVVVNLFVYLSFITITFIGFKFQKINNYSILLSSTTFFILSNFGVWILGFPKTIEGLILCYYMALPFFVYTIMGDLFYSYAMKYGLRYALNKKIVIAD